MVKPSNRGMDMPFSPIRKLVPSANAAVARGTKVYYLNIGQPDIPTPQVGLDALKNIDRSVLEYSPSEGLLPFRKNLSKYYERVGLSIGYDEIIVTTGGSEALQLCFNACLDAGDEIIIPEPAYANYLSFARTAGINVIPLPCSIENGFALPPVEDFERVITPQTKAILICNPNNPTGYVYSREELDAIAEIARKHNLFVIADEVYREFCYGNKFTSIMSMEGMDDNVVLVDSVSKRYSECGIRIGCVVTHNTELRQVIMKYAQARLSPPLLGQLVASASIDAPESYLKDVYDEYKKRRDFVIERLNKIPGCFTPMPNGAFYTMVQLPVDNIDKFCKWCLDEFEYEGGTILMAPGSGFYSNPDLGYNQARIAYVHEIPYLAKALDCLEAALEAYNRK